MAASLPGGPWETQSNTVTRTCFYTKKTIREIVSELTLRSVRCQNILIKGEKDILVAGQCYNFNVRSEMVYIFFIWTIYLVWGKLVQCVIPKKNISLYCVYLKQMLLLFINCFLFKEAGTFESLFNLSFRSIWHWLIPSVPYKVYSLVVLAAQQIAQVWNGFDISYEKCVLLILFWETHHKSQV